jgi:hypothetical protein
VELKKANFINLKGSMKKVQEHKAPFAGPKVVKRQMKNTNIRDNLIFITIFMVKVQIHEYRHSQRAKRNL